MKDKKLNHILIMNHKNQSYICIPFSPKGKPAIRGDRLQYSLTCPFTNLKRLSLRVKE